MWKTIICLSQWKLIIKKKDSKNQWEKWQWIIITQITESEFSRIRNIPVNEERISVLESAHIQELETTWVSLTSK